jgi:hypothetical protein
MYIHSVCSILSFAMLPQHVWNTSVIFGQFILAMLVETHVRLAYVPGDDNMKSREHALKLTRAVFYFACMPIWWLIPLTYNNPIGNEPVWEEYTALLTYVDVIIVCVCCSYGVELLYISIPAINIKTGAHHVGTLLLVYSIRSDWVVLWEFPDVLYAGCFLSGMCTLHLVSYVYHFTRDPLMYKWYRGVGIWITVCIIYFHVNYTRVFVNSLARDTPMLLCIVRVLLWVLYIVDHVDNLQRMYAIHARLKTRCGHQASNNVLVAKEAGVGVIMVTYEEPMVREGE